jgi:tRNA(Arg) A34 adenosine deaminase TadA
MKPQFMLRAIEQARMGMLKGEGGPFGAVVVKAGELISVANNEVTSSLDPTAHAEVLAIRRACANLKTFSLEGCELYTSCEPCPMCLAAAMWARIDKVYFAANRQDAREAGFDDEFFYQQLALPMEYRALAMKELLRPEAQTVFELWKQKQDKISY